FAEPVAVSSTSEQCIRLPPSSSPGGFGLVPLRARRDAHAALIGGGRQPRVSRYLRGSGRTAPSMSAICGNSAKRQRGKERDVSTLDEPVSFERDIKPLFRDRDRGAMKFFVDLWSHDDVARESDEILERLRDGSMPCDGAWDDERIALFQ